MVTLETVPPINTNVIPETVSHTSGCVTRPLSVRMVVTKLLVGAMSTNLNVEMEGRSSVNFLKINSINSFCTIRYVLDVSWESTYVTNSITAETSVTKRTAGIVPLASTRA